MNYLSSNQLINRRIRFSIVTGAYLLLITIPLFILSCWLLLLPDKVVAQNGNNLNPKVGLSLMPAWTSASSDVTSRVAWGDMDADGDLDLAVGNFNGRDQIYLNVNGTLDTTPVWVSADSDNTYSVAWGDVDNDGDLDLATGNTPTYDWQNCKCYTDEAHNKLYLNVNGMLQTTPAWVSADSDGTVQIDWADMDGDGDLDLAAANRRIGIGRPNKVYLNEDGMLQSNAAWVSADISSSVAAAWGDVDGDGDPDLAIGNIGAPNKLYLNENGMLQTTPTWTSSYSATTWSLAWGDVDDDDDLDLAVRNSHEPHELYLNEGGKLQSTAIWKSEDSPSPQGDAAWGDVDSDGDLDLAIGSSVYLNENKMLQTIAAWTPDKPADIGKIAWGDVDNDGDLDLAVGKTGRTSLYKNESDLARLRQKPVWTSTESGFTESVAWGDIDRDGDLDLATGNVSAPSHVYLNIHGMLQTDPAWRSSAWDRTGSVAWGDMDGDGDLDLAVGNMETLAGGQPNRVYINEGGMLQPDAAWVSEDKDRTHSVAWGDMDGDGDLDLAVGNHPTYASASNSYLNDGQNKVYVNNGTMLERTASWVSADSERTNSVAWGDIDNDGDVDLAAGNAEAPNRVYLNDGGILQTTAIWSSEDADDTTSIAWGDINSDGYLDLVAGNSTFSNAGGAQASKVYLNNNGMLQLNSVSSWTADDDQWTEGAALGDVDLDGDLDLAIGNWQASWADAKSAGLYINERGKFQLSAGWSISDSNSIGDVTSVAWGDMDGDGDLDLATGAGDSLLLTGGKYPNRVFLNQSPGYSPYDKPSYVTFVTDNISLNGNPALIFPIAPANHYATTHIHHTSSIPFLYSLVDPTGNPVRFIRAFYSPNGGGYWLEAIPTNDTIVRNLSTSAVAGRTITNTHIFNWDVFGSGFFGKSDNVIFRIEAHLGGANSFQRAYIATQTFPFRVQGTQVRVYRETVVPGKEQSGAIVYHLLANQSHNATPISGPRFPWRTDINGYLQGRGELRIGDRLAALWPVSSTNLITFTHNYTLYQTSAKPTATTLDMQFVDKPGVQVLTVTVDNKLLLFNLDVALEWDARKDTQFMQQLHFNLQRTSELLFDWSNGQAALGQVRIFQDAKRNTAVSGFAPWEDSHIRIYATNRMRPSATVGGIVSPTLAYTETVVVASKAKTLSYGAGQVHMGAVWNRYGESSGTLGEDWPRALAHELGHYLFFLEDNYLGVNEQGVLVTIPAEGDANQSCPSVMNDPYREAQSEFHPQTDWATSGCTNTLSQQSVGRSDWETITRFYPLTAPTQSFTGQNQGPGTLPLAVTQLQVISPTATAQTIDVPLYYLTQANGGTYLPSANAQAYLFQGDRLTALGQPTLDQVQAWGARPGDRLCIYEATGYIGCEPLRVQDDQVAMKQPGNWQPEIVVTPVTSRTIALNVNVALGNGKLGARLYPTDAPAPSCILLQAAGAEQFTGIFPPLDMPALEGYVHLWVQPGSDIACLEPQGDATLETVTGYAIGGNPVHRRARRTLTRGGGVHRRARRAPVISADGQVIIFGEALDANQEEEWFFTLQALSTIPAIPPGRSLVGQAYRLTTSPNAPPLTDTSISFSYLGDQVPAGEENFLRLYFRDPNATACQPNPAPCWRPLDTFKDLAYNVASAKTQGPGLYALMSSLEVPLTNPGWNNFAYPVPGTRPVAEALAAIAGAYTVIYSYQPSGTEEAWRVYSPDAPDWVNDLDTLAFGQGYWLYTTAAVTLYLQGQETAQAAATAGLTLPPATFYGIVAATPDFTPQLGMVVTAWIDGQRCGQSQVQAQGGQLVYVIKVAAADGSANTGCGVEGRSVTFQVNAVTLATQGVWDNTQVVNLSPSPQGDHLVFLPVVRR